MADQGRGPPHNVLLALALGVVMAGPSIVGDLGGTMFELLGPVGALLLPVVLLILARLLSTDQGAGVFNALTAGSYDSTNAVSLVLLMLLLLLFYKRVFLSGGDEGEEE